MELKKYKLSDVATVEISNVDKKSKEGEAVVRLCNFTDVYYNWAVTNEMVTTFMEASASDKQIERFSLKKGQVALTKDSETRYDIGIPTYIADDFDNVILGYHCALITPDESKISGKYLNAFMNSPFIHKYFANSASGSGQRYALSVEVLESMPLLLPSLEEQKRIGDIFSKLDRKIALNRAINKNLEALAKQIYDYWFIQFDFPDENGRPYKSSGGQMFWDVKLKREIPVIWKSCKLGEFVNVLDSKRIPLSVADRKIRPGIYPYYGATSIMDYIDDYIFDNEYVLLAEDGSTSDVNGFPIIQFIWGKTWVNNHAHVLETKNRDFLYYLYQTVKMIPAKLMETGSIQKKISQENLLRQYILLPSEDMLYSYCTKAEAIVNAFKQKEKEINELTKQRDELLPLLMNGQVTIE